jgi:hypothetical protein
MYRVRFLLTVVPLTARLAEVRGDAKSAQASR